MPGAIGWRSLRLAGLADGEPLGLTGFGASALVEQPLAISIPRSKYVCPLRTRTLALSLGAGWAGTRLKKARALPPSSTRRPPENRWSKRSQSSHRRTAGDQRHPGRRRPGRTQLLLGIHFILWKGKSKAWPTWRAGTFGIPRSCRENTRSSPMWRNMLFDANRALCRTQGRPNPQRKGNENRQWAIGQAIGKREN